jgi:hypothetical protein
VGERRSAALRYQALYRRDPSALTGQIRPTMIEPLTIPEKSLAVLIEEPPNA